MTQPNETSRLDRLETLAETILLAIQQQQSQTQENSAQISGLRASVQDTVQMVGTLASEMHLMQADIRGLQTENRRILERLEQHMSNGHGEP
jgi:hypothetical protein